MTSWLGQVDLLKPAPVIRSSRLVVGVKRGHPLSWTGRYTRRMEPNALPPKVFISYSWTSTAHEDRVLDLATRLTKDGVHVILDKWDLAPGHDVFVFMEKMANDPDVKHVLLICDRSYAEKANARAGGVGVEASIASAKVYGKADQNKFIPIVFEKNEDGTIAVPHFVSTRIYIDLSSDGMFAGGYESLLRLIFDKPARQRPAIGKPPSFLAATSSISPATLLIRGSSNLSDRSAGQAASLAKKQCDSLLADFRAQRLLTPPEGEIDEIILAKIQELKPLRDVAIDWIREVVDVCSSSQAVSVLAKFFEELITISNWPMEVSSWEAWRADHLAFVARELWLYTIAILIDHRKGDLISDFLAYPLCSTINREFKPCSYHSIDRHLMSLEQVANSKKETKRISVLADLVKERADRVDISFDMLAEADFVLCLRDITSVSSNQQRWWFPRLLVFVVHHPSPLPLFVRWRAGQWPQGIPALLATPSREEILRVIRKKQEVLRNYHFDFWQLDFIAFADLNDLDRGSR